MAQKKKTSRKEQFWFTSSPSIIVVDRHFMVRTVVSSDLNRLVKRICRISRLKVTHFSLKRVELAKNWIITPVSESLVGGNSSARLNLFRELSEWWCNTLIRNAWLATEIADVHGFTLTRAWSRTCFYICAARHQLSKHISLYDKWDQRGNENLVLITPDLSLSFTSAYLGYRWWKTF